MGFPTERRRQNGDKFENHAMHLFGVAVLLLLRLADWPLRWLLSGAPLLTYALLLGDSHGSRVLPFATTWTLVATVNLLYAISATSWLFYWIFSIGCYVTLTLTCLYQFKFVSQRVRGTLRKLLYMVDFVNDTIAYFNIPALEIDTEVRGLFVIRGLTFSLSSLSVVVHGVEVGIKLSDDLELAIQTDEVNIFFFRKIVVSDVYANLKGGNSEMTFHDLAENPPPSAIVDSVLDEDTPLLKVAASWKVDGESRRRRSTQAQLTDGNASESTTMGKALASVTQLSPEDEKAKFRYENELRDINETSLIQQSKQRIKNLSKNLDPNEVKDAGWDDDKAIRAAVCSQLHRQPSVPHPPRRSIKVTTLQNLAPPKVRRFLHRLPMLLRLLLNPLSYFHPVQIKSITASGSGAWIQYMLNTSLFKEYSSNNSALRALEKRIYSWLTDANFVAQLVGIKGQAAVPFLTDFDITSLLKVEDIVVHRALPMETRLHQVIRVGGGDAFVGIPSYLLPHHEHLLPPRPTNYDEVSKAEKIADAPGKVEEVRAVYELKRTVKDETELAISAHVRLPAVFDQEVLNFASALVKASKVIEMEKGPDAVDEERSGLKQWAHAAKTGVKGSFDKVTVEGIMNDRWIAKLVGKVMKMVEAAQGDLGYSGLIPLPLEPYRNKDWDTKVLP